MASDRSDGSDRSSSRLRASGGYRSLRSFQSATVIYDATVSFCDRFLDRRSRTVDQMVQAARSGRQNIAEGSRASGASTQTELRLVSVARASLEELLLDYEDFLRQRGLRLWGKNDPEALEVRQIATRSKPSDRTDQADYSLWLRSTDPGVVANALICLIHQANYLLDKQIVALERDFITRGGYSERLAAARLEERKRSLTDRTDRTDRAGLPRCPLCDQPMVVRTVRQGARTGEQFLGCSRYPDCRGAKPIGSVGSARSVR